MTGIKLYSGMAQNARTEVAVAPDGRAFIRHWRYNGYGYGWSRWARYSVEYVTRTYSAIDGAPDVEITIPHGQLVSCGFANLPLVTENARVRLPR